MRHSENAPPPNTPGSFVFPYPVCSSSSATPDQSFYPSTPTPAPFYPHYPPSAHAYSAPPHPGSLSYPFPPHFVSFGQDPSTPSPFPGHTPGVTVPPSQADIDPSLWSSAITNSPDTQGATQTRKRKNTKSVGGQNAPPAKKRKSKTSPDVGLSTTGTTVPELEAATTCGVGPPHSASLETQDDNTVPLGEPPSSSPDGFRVFRRPQKPRDHSKTAATDVWHHLRALTTSAAPDIWPEDLPELEPVLKSFPTTEYVGCKLCSNPKNRDKRKWKTWKHGTGMTSCYRAHMKNNHMEEYERAIAKFGLKEQEIEGDQGDAQEHLPFSVEMFHHLLMKWIVADDQSINVTESIQFRDLLNYLGGDNISDEDIPHRTKLTTQIIQEYKVEYEKMKLELQNALGRISLTTDLWSDPNRDSFMAITAHFMARNAENRLEYRDHLLAFRFIDGSHSGPHLADEFFKVLDEAGIRHKLGQITMDNASNNNTMMRELEHLLRARGVTFHHDGNRVRCFPHVINLAVQAFLAALKANPSAPLSNILEGADPITIANMKKYVATLERDLVGTGRGVVTACRASGQRRRDLRKLIEDGNDSGYWKGKMINPAHDSMPEVQLLRDCETRWSSTFNLIDRIILLHPAIVRFLQRPEHSDLCHLSLNDYEIGVLCDIHQALEIPHVAQQTFSFERTPTLSMAIPLYEMLNHEWKNLKATIPELSHYISVATGKIDEYIEEGRKTRIYALAMILNPAMKFEWMKAHWLPEDVKKAQNWILEMTEAYQRAARFRSQVVGGRSSDWIPASTVSRAAQVHAKRIGRLQGLAAVRRSVSYTSAATSVSSMMPSTSDSHPSTSESGPGITTQSPPPALTPEERREQEARACAEDRTAAERELRRYEEDNIKTDGSSERSSDLVRFWELHEHVYPLLFRVAMDVLPAQASSVPCERAFSSSKETCALRRNNLSPHLLEALQVLKFKYKQEGLSFTSDLIAKPQDYSISGELSEHAALELIAAGSLGELNDCLTIAVIVSGETCNLISWEMPAHISQTSKALRSGLRCTSVE